MLKAIADEMRLCYQAPGAKVPQTFDDLAYALLQTRCNMRAGSWSVRRRAALDMAERICQLLEHNPDLVDLLAKRMELQRTKGDSSSC